MYIYSRIYHQFRVTSFYLCTSLRRHHRTWKRWRRKGTGSLRQTYHRPLRDWMNIVVQTCRRRDQCTRNNIPPFNLRECMKNYVRYRGENNTIGWRRKIWRIFNVVPFAEYESRRWELISREKGIVGIDFTSCFLLLALRYFLLRSHREIQSIQYFSTFILVNYNFIITFSKKNKSVKF